MEKFEVVFKVIRQLFWSLLLEGFFLMALGVLIAIFPELLDALVSVVFIVLGIAFIIISIKIHKYSKLTINL
jgi:hypothetical protein